MVAISIAQYSRKANAVRERTLKRYRVAGTEFESDFIRWADAGHPVYGWYSDKWQSRELAVSHAYRGEYMRIID